mgnify:CR=1 FL=1
MNKLVAVARGELPADFVIRNARLANVFTLEYENSVDVAICGTKIAGIAKSGSYDGKKIIDANARVMIPGMIDGHVHIEDTMMTPPGFAEIAAIHGTSTVMADPHEIANALGMSGLEYMFKTSQGLPIDIFFGAPSCVPASDFETPYDELDMIAIKNMFDKNLCQHLGEVMNFPAVISGDAEIWGKILAAGNVPLTGHAPGVSGKNLNAYLVSGISSDHECVNLDEAREKLRLGMWLMIREGASFLDLKTLLPLIQENVLNAARCMVVSDDITARYLLENGHMDVKMRIMCREGLDPLVALRMVTLSPAEYFRLYDRGAIAPGRLADFALLDSDRIDENFRVQQVWKNGLQVMSNDDVFTRENNSDFLAPVLKTRVKNIPTLEQIKIKIPDSGAENINVIGVTEGTVITKTLQLKPLIKNGCVVPDVSRDIAKIVVLERHRDTGRFGVGFVSGLGIKRGAVGSSVAHDAHNYVVAGADDESIITALKNLAEMGGGLTVTDGEKVLNSFALPIGGLMCYLNPYEVSENLTKLENSAENLGIMIKHPFMVLSFLCLTVIPELRITDQGYVDITRGGIQKIFA